MDLLLESALVEDWLLLLGDLLKDEEEFGEGFWCWLRRLAGLPILDTDPDRLV